MDRRVDLKLIREHASKNRINKFQDPLAALAAKLASPAKNVRGTDSPNDEDIFASTGSKRRSSTLLLTASPMPSPSDQLAPIAAMDANLSSTKPPMSSSPIQPSAALSTNSPGLAFPPHPTCAVFNLQSFASQPNSDSLIQLTQALLPAASGAVVPMKVKRPAKKHLTRDLANLQTWSKFQVQVPQHGSRTKMQWITTLHGDKMKARVRRSERLKTSDRLITYKF